MPERNPAVQSRIYTKLWLLPAAMALFGMCGAPAMFGQATAKTPPNRLLVGKLLYVAPMEGGMDGWLIEDLRQWGKYKVTGNSEGVDLVLKSYKPEKDMEWENRAGVPVPKGEGKRRKGELPAVSFAVIDWVTGEPLWQTEVLNHKQKKDEPDPPAGPRTQIFARDLTPDQIAQRVTTKLRQYVAELEKQEGAKP